jgi:hypothetical protein
LVNVVQEETKHIWNDDDILAVGPIRGDLMNGPITSVYITLEKNGYSQPTVQQNQQSTTTIPATSLPTTSTTTPLSTTLPTTAASFPTGLNAGATTFHPSTNAKVPTYQSPPPLLDGLTGQPTNPIRIITKITKMYVDSDKFDSEGSGSLNSKLDIFHVICYNAGLLEIELLRAFPIMLKGLARDHFYAYSLHTRTYNEAISHLRGLFEGAKFQRTNLDKWNAANLPSIILENPGKSVLESL